MNKEEKEIYIPRKKKPDIYKLFKTNRVTLGSALKFKTRSGFAKQLRAAALQRGGVIYTGYVPENFMPSCETTFDHGDNKIRQAFGDGLSVEVDRESNTATIRVDEQTVVVIPGMTMDKWMRVLYWLQMFINELH